MVAVSVLLPEHDPTNEQLRERLRMAEESLRRSERLAIAGRFAGAIIHEVNNPLEALSNLVYLTKQEAQDPENVRKNMLVAEKQLDRREKLRAKRSRSIANRPIQNRLI